MKLTKALLITVLTTALPASAAPGDCHVVERSQKVIAVETELQTQVVTDMVCGPSLAGPWACVPFTHEVKVAVKVPVEKTKTSAITICEGQR